MTRRNPRFVVAFLAPAVLVYATFVLVPLVQAAIVSLYRWRGVSARRTFVGLDNFRWAWGDAALRQSLGNALWLLLFSFIAVFVGGIAAAHALNHPGKLARTVRGLILFPQVVSIVAVAVLWQYLFLPDRTGLVNAILGLFGIGGREWLGDPATALPSVGVAFVWHALGFYALLFLAGIRGIASETLEAAELDGSTGLHRLRTITWPLLWSVKRIATTYLVINVLNVFALVLLMTNGGQPDRHTEMPLTYLYEQAFDNSQFGRGTSLAVVYFALAMLLSVVVMVIYRKDPVEGRA